MRKFFLTAGLAALLTQSGFAQGRDGTKLDPEKSLFRQIDQNNDGTVTATELERFFRSLDTSGDGNVGRDEFAKRPGADAGEIGSADASLIKRLLGSFDADKDGRLTKDELPEGGAAAILERFDADGDGIVTRDELSRTGKDHRFWTLADRDKSGSVSGDEQKALLRAIDRNGNGKLTEREFQLAFESKKEEPAAQPERRRGRGRGGFDPDRFFQRFDKNEDGEVTKDELPGRAAGLLDRLDRNGDGKITRDDFGMQGGGGQGQRGRGGAPAGGGGDREAMFERLDTNSDGKLTGDELPERAKRMMSRVDTNGDGVLSKEEFVGGPGGGSRGPRGSSGSRGPSQRFERGAPDEGEPLPDLVALDSNGKKFRLSSLKGSYAVLVFGCLT